MQQLGLVMKSSIQPIRMVIGILFLICMDLSFLHTLITIVIVSLFGQKINPKAFELDRAMFKVAPSTLALIIITFLLLTALYVKFY